MKNLSKYLFLFLISTLVIFSSCKDDDDPNPSAITIEIEDDEIEGDSYKGHVGDVLDFSVVTTAPDGFNTFRISKSVDGTVDANYDVEVSRIDPEFLDQGTPNAFSYDFEYTLTEAEAGKDVVFTFEVVDEKGQTKTQNFTVEVVPVKLYTAVLLAAPLSDLSSQTFFSTNTGEKFSIGLINSTQASISPNVDFGYFYGENFNATLASPASYPIDYGQSAWSKTNSTKLKKTNVSTSDFMEKSGDLNFINNAFTNSAFGADQGQVTNLSVGDVIAFETDASKTGGAKRGLIRIVQIVGTTGQSDYIEIEVLVTI